MNEDEIILPVQHMFPNCQKYKKCCSDDKEFWNKVEIQQNDGHLTEDKVVYPHPEIEHQLILHNVNGYKIDRKRDKIPKTPVDFEAEIDEMELAKRFS